MKRRGPQHQPRQHGRQRLITAGLRLAAKNGSFGAIGMRELAREAGLNPSTFYRHFSDFDELGLAAVALILPALREDLHAQRRGSPTLAEARRRSVRHFFDFAARNPEAITVAARELHGTSPRLRAALAEGLSGISEDLVEDVLAMHLPTFNDAGILRDLANAIVKQIFALALDYIAESEPSSRAAIVERAERFVNELVVGTYITRSLGIGAATPIEPLLGSLLKPLRRQRT